jgi:hypothetical protein
VADIDIAVFAEGLAVCGEDLFFRDHFAAILAL